MDDHRFIGDTTGSRDRFGHLLPSAVATPALCSACGATPEDPECLCSEKGEGDDVEAFKPNPVLLIPDDVATPTEAAPEAPAADAVQPEAPAASAEPEAPTPPAAA